ncbi:MAG: 1-(5-phosphoribosyl)-5-amino-4-imidazole-carboxylate carboxylase [Candidatus Moduliflexus flocculans]|nr:1-(5-phosphoribosyl)-5-amino-4-imidazole-carboxylate carboxylase [Candidatus Moduliflexus flocculans]
MKKRLEEILEKVRSGRLSTAKALELLEGYPYCDLDFAKVDHLREVAKGAPEIVFGLGKTPGPDRPHLAGDPRDQGSNLLVTRVEPAAWAQAQGPSSAARSTTRPPGRSAGSRPSRPAGRGTIVVLTAGTSDIPVAEEAAVTAEVAGQRRSSASTTSGWPACTGSSASTSASAGPASIVAVAGMEGALPSVVAGLVTGPGRRRADERRLRRQLQGAGRPAGHAQRLSGRGRRGQHRQRLRGRLPGQLRSTTSSAWKNGRPIVRKVYIL